MLNIRESSLWILQCQRTESKRGEMQLCRNKINRNIFYSSKDINVL